MKRRLGIGFFGAFWSGLLLSWGVLGAVSWASVAVPLSEQVAQVLSENECEIWRDEQGIPHLRGSHEIVGLACMGYLHGRDRSWEMDYFRRILQGRKAEIAGKDSIRSDFFMRLLGLQERAASIFQQMSPKDQRLLWAYTLGVNRGFKEALDQGVYEFIKLGYQPEPWKPEHTVGLFLLQSFDQTKRSFQSQFDQEKWAKEYGEDGARLFRSEGLPWDTSILKEGEYRKSLPEPKISDSSQKNERLTVDIEKELSGVFGGVGQGSNNWVISPKRSQSGHAWMANDPHLRLSYPSFWYWIHVQAGDLDVIGASFPGVPLIVSGSNRHVSWGVTNSFLPVSRVTYVAEKELEQAQTFRPLIWVRFWKFQLPFFFKSYRRTAVKGLPILPLPSPEGQAIVLRWTGFDLHPNDLMGMADIMKSKNAKEADQAFSRARVPSWNFVFADDQGQIGYRAIGRIPKFGKNEIPFGIPTQSLSEVENSTAFGTQWTPEETPHLFNPKRGMIVTANNRHWPSDSALNAGYAQHIGFRSYRIEELLGKEKLHNLLSLQKIQCDVQAVDARFLLPALLKVMEKKPEYQGVLSVLKSWNYETNLECTACGLYRRWVSWIIEKRSLNIPSLYRKLTENPKGVSSLDESLKKTIFESFELALHDLKFTARNGLPKWGDLHLNSFQHLAGPEFSPAEPVGTPGDDYTVNLGNSEWDGEHLNHIDGPSQRLIVEMSRPPKVYSVLAGENLDLEKRNLKDPKSEWQKWVRCDQQQRVFPVDWSQIRPQTKVRF